MILFPSWKVVWFNVIILIFLKYGLLAFYFSEHFGIHFYINTFVNSFIITVVGYFNIRSYYFVQQQEQISLSDPLTKARNRRYLDEVFRIYEYPKQPSLFVALIDIDNFKKLNDTYGHLYGDYALKKMVDLIQKHLDETSTLIRFGGEEFLTLFHDKSELETYQTIEQIRNSIENYIFKQGNHTFSITISIGIAKREGDFSLYDIIGNADWALYKAKRTGKNKVVFYKDDISVNEGIQ